MDNKQSDAIKNVLIAVTNLHHCVAYLLSLYPLEEAERILQEVDAYYTEKRKKAFINTKEI